MSLSTLLKCLCHSSKSLLLYPTALIRITLGLFFFSSGFNKITVLENRQLMIETMIHAGLPYPEIMATFVASTELIVGLFLALGLLSRLSGLLLLVISMVALITVGLSQIPTGINLITWYSWLLYFPESSYILLLILLITQGGGPFSVDKLIYNKLTNKIY
ncbi:DoxX family protein [Yersinia mollaretii]|uniref:DoxX family protein n=1 Tax=Yersinia mollaretii TaxID=33060 RepID=UPI001427D0D5|nr:DoxX family protein [Yersinia mollaretii]MDA5535817.1 DoxX family protein [Yersinia mollaretii]NIL03951.1 DoxX family protein [Yersinia mollaretii]